MLSELLKSACIRSYIFQLRIFWIYDFYSPPYLLELAKIIVLILRHRTTSQTLKYTLYYKHQKVNVYITWMDI